MCRGSALPSPHRLQAEALPTHWAQSAPKDGTENKAILATATGPFCDFEAFLQQNRHCCVALHTEKSSPV